MRTVVEWDACVFSKLEVVTHFLRESRSVGEPALGPERLGKRVKQRWVTMHYRYYCKDVAGRTTYWINVRLQGGI
jgi:hypothetical protein